MDLGTGGRDEGPWVLSGGWWRERRGGGDRGRVRPPPHTSCVAWCACGEVGAAKSSVYSDAAPLARHGGATIAR